jgi:secretion/DNA translocation related CpaE-like protein
MPLLLTSDAVLLDDLLRLAAAGGADVEVAPDPVAARSRWGEAPLVLVGADQAEACLRARLPHRARVVLVGRSAAGEPRWDLAELIGAGHLAVLPAAEPWLVDRFAGVLAPSAGWELPSRPASRAGDQPAAGRETGVGDPARSSSGRTDAGDLDRPGGPVPPVADPTVLDSPTAAVRPVVPGLPAAPGTSAVRDAHVPRGVPAAPDLAGASGRPGRVTADRATPSTTTAGRVVAVLGGRGGAGASVLAGALAVTAARSGLRTLLVDADPLGGGLDLVLGWEQVEGLRWPGLTQADGQVDAPALVRALPGRGDLVMLSWDRGTPLPLPAAAMRATVDAGRRGRDLVVVDLPRHLDDASVAALHAADRAYLVVPAELRATAAAARVVAVATLHCPDLSVVVRGPAPGRLKAREVARALDLPLAGTLRPEPSLGRALERGEAPASSGRGPLADLCQRLLAESTGAAVPEAA